MSAAGAYLGDRRGRRLTADSVREQARGRWLDIFRYMCPGMFDDAIDNLGQHVDCPFHGGEKDFRFKKRGSSKGGNTADSGVAMCTCGVYADGFAVLQRALNLSFYDVLKQVDAYFNGTEIDRPIPAPKAVVSTKEKRSDAEILGKVKSLWEAGKPLDLATTPYYAKRGIAAAVVEKVQDVSVLASLGYYTPVKGEDRLEKIGSYPTILAAMRKPQGELVAVHRTWLSKDRTEKAPVPKPKKLSETPDCVGAAIRLFDADGADTLGITEGIETALAAYQLAWGRYWKELGEIPVWACYAAGNIRTFEIPPEMQKTVRRLVIFADNDESGTGYKAATALKERMATEQPEVDVIIKMPDVVGWDWNDVLENL